MRASLDGISESHDQVFEIKFGEKVYSYVRQNKSVPRYHYGQLQHILAITKLEYINYLCGWENVEPIHLLE